MGTYIQPIILCPIEYWFQIIASYTFRIFWIMLIPNKVSRSRMITIQTSSLCANPQIPFIIFCHFTDNRKTQAIFL